LNTRPLRLLSSARRAPKSVPSRRRGYAEVADKIKLSLVHPHQVRVDFSNLRWRRQRIGPAGKFFNNPPTPFIHSEDGLYRIRAIPRHHPCHPTADASSSKRWIFPDDLATVHPAINAVKTPQRTGPAGNFFDNPPTPPTRSEDGLYRIRVIPPFVTRTTSRQARFSRRSPQQAHNQRCRGKPPLGAPRRISPAGNFFDNPPTPPIRSEDGLYRIRVIPHRSSSSPVLLHHRHFEPSQEVHSTTCRRYQIDHYTLYLGTKPM
jgi:hypothetical protein